MIVPIARSSYISPLFSNRPLRRWPWRVQFQGLSKYLDGARTPAQVHRAVTADVRRAARLIDAGLSSFAAFTPAAASG
jgi:hypothetical protein